MANPSPSLERVTTINRDGSRQFIHPADVHGPFTRWRALVGWLLVGVYVALPWIPIQGNPAVFFDVAARQFHLFGLTFVAQDLWLAFFVISGVGFALFYVAALLGRIWCGWGCPQTVFLDITRRMERWIEGNSLARQRLDQMPHRRRVVVRFRLVPRTILHRALSLRPVAVGSGGSRHAGHRIRRKTGRTARAKIPTRHRRLRGLQPLRASLPDRHRHPAGTPNGMHRVRCLRGRLQHGDEQTRPPPRSDPV
jgi:hypothetical protein